MKRTVFVILAVLLCTAFGRVWYVHPDSTQNCIQDCLDSCATSDTVLVGAGTYYENISWPSVQGVKLLSEYGRDTTIIDGGGVDHVVNIVPPVDTTTMMSGFTITHGYAEFGAGVRCDSNVSPLIADNLITLNTAYGATYGHGGGIGLVYGASPVIRGNVITRNRATGSWSGGGGIVCLGGCTPLIENNTVEGNWSSAGGGGIFCHDQSAATIIGNIIRYDTSGASGAGVCSQRASTFVFGNNIAYNYVTAFYGGGVWSGVDDASTIRGNTIESNVAPDGGGGIACGSNNVALIDSNEIRLNHALGNGGGISVWADRATPTISRNTIYGNSSDSCGGGIACLNSDPTTIGNEIDSNWARARGGGVFCESSSPVIVGNRITRNSVASPSLTHAGGGIHIRAQSHPLVEGNEIVYNTAPFGGGIACYSWSNPQINNNRFVGNAADSIGGGLDIYENSSPTLFGDSIAGNQAKMGGGISCYSNCSPTIEECYISANTATYGGGIGCQVGSNPQIRNTRIVGNTADSVGGGLDLYSNCSPTLRGDSIAGNQAKLGGGISCWRNCSPEIESCHIRINTGDGVYCDSASMPTILHSDIAGNSHYGVRNVYSGVTVMADSCWWGHATGPFHPVRNPLGRGDTVSDYVSFDDWEGVADERPRFVLLPSASATLLRGVLRLSETERAVLLDISGRHVADLLPGKNDIRHVAPGVYFVRRPETEDGRPRTAVHKVVVTR